MKCICGHNSTYHALTVPKWALDPGWPKNKPYNADGHCFHWDKKNQYCKCKKYSPKGKI